MAQGSRRFSPDPSPRERVGSGDETTTIGAYTRDDLYQFKSRTYGNGRRN